LAILAIALRETISIYIARIRKIDTSLSSQSIGYGKPILLESLEGLGTILIRWRKGRKNHIVRNHKVTCGIAYQRIVITIDGIEGLEIETIELERKGISYTYDTMKLLNERDPDTDYYFIIGADMVDYLLKWYRIDELVEMVQFVGVQRPRYKAGTSYPVIWVDVPLMDISSSMVREFIAQGRTPNFMLPKPVLDYIKKEGLY